MKKALLFLCLALTFLFVAPAQAHPPMSGGTIHIVQYGDTMFSIARSYGLDVWTVARANGITNPSFIYVGQRLVIPTNTAPGTAPQPATGNVHIVQPGETLYAIAARYGVSAWTIAQTNGIYNINHIFVGQRLVIPGLRPAPAPAPAPQPTPKPQQPPAPAPSTSGWQAAYYSGTEPTGGPVLERRDQAINFYWGQSSPDPRVPADEFSVKWTRTVNFRGGLYRFNVTADDGARIWIDGQVVLDAWTQAGAAATVDVTLTPGKHLVAVDYFEQDGVASVKFSFSRLGNAPSEPSTPAVTATPKADPNIPSAGWLGKYYDNQNLSGEPVATRMDNYPDFDWGHDAPIEGMRSDFFSVHWVGQVEFKADNYEFCAVADDGVQLFLDGKLIVDEWHPSDASQVSCKEIDIDTPGLKVIDIYYFEHGAKAKVQVWWDRH